MTDSALYISDLAKPKDDSWKKGSRISMDDLKNGRNGVEKIDAAELKNGRVSAANSSRSAPTPTRGGFTFAFGKYKGRLVADILEENKGYVEWCAREVDGFAAKLEAAGIEIDEEDFSQ